MARLHFMDTLVLAAGVVVLAMWSMNQAECSSVTPVGIAAYRRFHANDSLIGKPIPCTKEEKLCFRYNALFMLRYKACLPLAYVICAYAGNRNEFLNGSGHLYATCDEYFDPCPGYRMAYDGRCYPKEMVRGVICGCDAEPTQHILGGMECRCSPSAPIHVQQPEEDGKCLIPNHRFPDNRKQFEKSPHSSLEKSSTVLNCTSDQARCFSMGKVWVAEGRGCFPLRERGPCPAEHLVVLNGQVALQGRAEGVCVHQRGGCPQGQRRMAFDQRCYHDADLKLIAPGALYLTEFGDTVTTESFRSIRKVFLILSKSNHTDQNECKINREYGGTLGPEHQPKPPCGNDDKSKCSRYEVESQPPMPIID